MSQEDPLTDVRQLQVQLRQAQRAVEVAEAELREMSATIEKQRADLDKKDQQIIDLLAALRGKKRERIDPDQLLLFDIGELEQLLSEPPADECPSRRRRRSHGRRLLPEHLPHTEVLHELEEHERLCPHDGQPMQLIRYEISKQLEYTPAVLEVLVHKRAVYGCASKHDEARLITAPKPAQPIDKGLPGPGLLAAMVLGKFGDHLPGYRLEDLLFRSGVEIRRSTIYGWLAAAGDLVQGLVAHMRRRVLQSRVIHTDDTQVKLIDHAQRGTRLARFWAYVGDRGHPYIVYDFTTTRERIGPERFLQGYEGYLQADAYGGYDGIYTRSAGRIVEVACWAHCRRYWWKAREQDVARAHHVLAIIKRLFEIERTAKKMTATERQLLRQEHAVPLLEMLEQWLGEQDLLPKSRIGQAATYTRNQWAALCRYVEDGDLAIDNNISERCVKPVAIGRKAWLFVGSAEAGQRAANLMSLVASCKENRVEPWAYLRDLFKRLPAGEDVDRLLPDRWLEFHPEHRWTIADRREEERAAKGQL